MMEIFWHGLGSFPLTGASLPTSPLLLPPLPSLTSEESLGPPRSLSQAPQIKPSFRTGPNFLHEPSVWSLFLCPCGMASRRRKWHLFPLDTLARQKQPSRKNRAQGPQSRARPQPSLSSIFPGSGQRHDLQGWFKCPRERADTLPGRRGAHSGVRSEDGGRYTSWAAPGSEVGRDAGRWPLERSGRRWERALGGARRRRCGRGGLPWFRGWRRRLAKWKGRPFPGLKRARSW